MCLLLTVLFFGPRAALFLTWLFSSGRFDAAFGGWLLPFLGFIFLPWVTLAYTFLSPGGMSDLEWLLVLVAFVADLGTNGGSVKHSRRRDGRVGG